jgi:osmoprotectant transport system ATP-binding protein
MLLMDEPFGALDPITRAELHLEFRRIQDRVRKTVVIVTHDMREAFALATRIGVLDAGELIAFDTPDRLSSSTEPRVKQLIAT